MALKLISRGARLHPTQVNPGSGWVNVTKVGSTNPYFGSGVFTVQASNCDGVRPVSYTHLTLPTIYSV